MKRALAEGEGVTVAVVGTGSIGFRHLTVLQGLPGVRILALPRRAGRRDELAAQGYETCGTLREAADHGVRLAIIATDPGRHEADGLQALECGYHLLVEKPLAVDAAAARRLCRAAAAAHRQLFVGCVLRFAEALHRFRRELGRIGSLHAVRIVCQSFLPAWRPTRPYRDSYSARAGEGGVLRDLIHEIDYAGWLFGWPTTVTARLRNVGRLGIDAEESAEVVWDLPDGGLVSLHLDYLTQPTQRFVQASGRRGSLTWDVVASTVTLALADQPPQVWQSTQTREAMVLAQDRAAVASCGGSLHPDVATGEDGVRALAVCDAARRASERRCDTLVEYP